MDIASCCELANVYRHLVPDRLVIGFGVPPREGGDDFCQAAWRDGKDLELWPHWKSGELGFNLDPSVTPATNSWYH